MIQLNRITTDIKEINPVWTYSHYCKIPTDAFNGATIKIKSVFNPADDTPSFCIYYKDNKLKHKDFSTSFSGDHINLVQDLFKLNYSQSCNKIINDHSISVLQNKEFVPGTLSEGNKYKVVGYKKRTWNTLDKDYYLPFGIGSTLLEWGFVHPLAAYKMSNDVSDLQLSGDHIYGYFTKTGRLYKIYQPKNTESKFINVGEYEVGSEHDEPGNKFCAILSSWKDAMTFRSLGMKIDIRVPPSENTFFSKKVIDGLKKKYKKVFTLLDADDAGKKAMLRYQKEHNLPFVWLPLSKDISDSNRDHGKTKLLQTLLPLIHKHIN